MKPFLILMSVLFPFLLGIYVESNVLPSVVARFAQHSNSSASLPYRLSINYETSKRGERLDKCLEALAQTLQLLRTQLSTEESVEFKQKGDYYNGGQFVGGGIYTNDCGVYADESFSLSFVAPVQPLSDAEIATIRRAAREKK